MFFPILNFQFDDFYNIQGGWLLRLMGVYGEWCALLDKWYEGCSKKEKREKKFEEEYWWAIYIFLKRIQ